MTYRGKVRNGVVVLDDPASLPEGTAVRVEPIQEPAQTTPPAGSGDIWDRLLELAGSAKGLPPDLPERHDHYRRQRRAKE